MPNPPPIALNSDAFLGKSRHYIQRALALKDANDFEQYQLWASLAIELLGKSKLSSIHPSLVADPTHAPSLFAASGIVQSTDFKTINAHTIFERLKVVVDGFDEKTKDFCVEIAQRRNAELHSGESPFVGVRAESWESKYWHAVDLILRSMNSSLDDWIGSDAAATRKALLSHVARARADAIGERIDRASENFRSRKAADRRAATERAIGMRDRERGLLFDTIVEAVWDCSCPACGSRGVMGGEQTEEEVLDTDSHGYGAWEQVRKHYYAEEFHCPACGLSLQGYDEIEASELDAEHSVEEEREMTYEPEYDNE